ncbi:hypothetical protein KR222_003480 [Zaprionus bogoriensis]|nr:hypothetical protein KR222_003480 [Zaprionus bogoriensis]
MDRKSRVGKISQPTKLVSTCNFVFDIIVTRFEAPSLPIDDIKLLTIEAVFNDITIGITKSRINVSEFKEGSGTEFTMDAEKVLEKLEGCGMPIKIKYNGLVLAIGQISFPEKMIQNMMEGMEEQSFIATCDVSLGGVVKGKLEVFYRLLVKCEDNRPKPKLSECMQFVDKSIMPKDILFLVSEKQRSNMPCDPCVNDLLPEEEEEPFKLDIYRFPTSEKPEPSPAENLLHFPAVDAITCELKKMGDECQQTLDYVLWNPKPPCRNAEALRAPCGPRCQQSIPGDGATYKPPSENDFLHLPQGPPEPAGNVCYPMMPIPEQIGARGFKHIRFCPVCLASMSWLPKFAACPKCGLKPMPLPPEKNPEASSSDAIIRKYLVKQSNSCQQAKPQKEEKDNNETCRCTCKFNKLCAHCRVRKAIAEMNINFRQAELPPRSTVVLGEQGSDEDLCAMNEQSTVSRPFLARVFSELRDLYDLKDTRRTASNTNTSRKSVSKKIKTIDSPYGHHVQSTGRISKTRHKVVSSHHKNCTNPARSVSHRHGWAWRATREARKHGWRPGAILKPIKKIMEHFLECSQGNAMQICRRQKKKAAMRQQPILSMCRKNGEILITLRAVNSPNVDMKPITFRVVKSDLAVALKQIKQKLKKRGFRKCTCHQPVMLCVCRNIFEKRMLERELQKECHMRGMQSCVEHLVLTDTSESEMEFDFEVSPPASQAKPCVAVKPRTINHCTQTMKDDLKVIPLYPRVKSDFYRAYDCAAGDRYGNTAFGDFAENAFEDGVFGYRGGGLHGKSAYPFGRQKMDKLWGAKPGGPFRGGGRFPLSGPPGGKTFPVVIKGSQKPPAERGRKQSKGKAKGKGKQTKQKKENPKLQKQKQQQQKKQQKPQKLKQTAKK